MRIDRHIHQSCKRKKKSNQKYYLERSAKTNLSQNLGHWNFSKVAQKKRVLMGIIFERAQRWIPIKTFYVRWLILVPRSMPT